MCFIAVFTVFLQICMEHQHEKLYIKFSFLIINIASKNQGSLHPSFSDLVRTVWRRVEAAVQRVKSERKEDSESGAASPKKYPFPEC